MAEIRIAKHEDLEVLQGEVQNKADGNHTHSEYATTGALTTGLSGKSDAEHEHAYSEITGTPTIPSDVSGEVAALRSELDELKLVVDGLTNPPEEPV